MEARRRNRKTSLALWQDREYRERTVAGTREAQGRPEVLARKSEIAKALWRDPEYRSLYVGENNCNWRGGVSLYTPPGWSDIAEGIRSRDRHRCVLCGNPENGRAHDVHHIDYDRHSNEPSNLVTLCHPCHSKTTNGDRDGWRSLFAE